MKGTWDSIHVIEVGRPTRPSVRTHSPQTHQLTDARTHAHTHSLQVDTTQKTKGHYKMTSTIMLTIETETASTGTISLAGNLTRQVCSSLVWLVFVLGWYTPPVVLSQPFSYPIVPPPPPPTHPCRTRRISRSMTKPTRTYPTLVVWSRTWRSSCA